MEAKLIDAPVPPPVVQITMTQTQASAIFHWLANQLGSAADGNCQHFYNALQKVLRK